MAAIKKSSDKYTTTYTYKYPREKSLKSLDSWLCLVVNSELLNIDEIIFQDTINSTKDSATVHLSTPVKEKEFLVYFSFYSEIEKINNITFDGKYKKVPFAVDINLDNYEVGVTFDNFCPFSEYEIEDMLNLKQRNYNKI